MPSIVGMVDNEALVRGGHYVVTALGIPYVVTLLIAVHVLHSLQGGRDGRLGRIGRIMLSCGLIAFLPPFAYGLIAGVAKSVGPTYMLATLASFLGLALFAAGSFNARVLPRWIFPPWVVAWITGGPLAYAAMPLLLAAVYLTIAYFLPSGSGDQPSMGA
jgi:hypothetical protein